MNLIGNQYFLIWRIFAYKWLVFFIILIAFVCGSSQLVYSQSSDIHSFNIQEKEKANLDYADSLLNRDLPLTLSYLMHELNTEMIVDKPDYYTSMLSKAVNVSFLIGKIQLCDSLDSVIMNYPKKNQHPIIQAKISLSQAYTSRSQRRYLESLQYAKESLLNFQKNADIKGQLNAISLILRIYFDLKNFTSAIQYVPEIEKLSVHLDDVDLRIGLLLYISKLYVYLEKYSDAQSYLTRAQKLINDYQVKKQEPAFNFFQALNYYNQRNYTKAFNYLEKAAKGKYEWGSYMSMSSTITFEAAIAMRQKKYVLAEYYNREALKIREECGNRYLTASSHFNIASCLIEQYKFKSAESHIAMAEKLYSIYNLKPSVKRGNQLLKKIYLLKKDYKNAYLTLKKIIQIDDSIYQHQNKIKLDELESNIKISQYELEKSNLQANTLKEKNQNETNKVMIKISLIVLAFSLIFSYLLFLHLREKNKRKLLLINQRMIFIQMNSHFVFNALTAIQSLLFQKQTESAIHYLTLFSNLVRKVLFVTERKYVGLQMEVSFIMEFLQLQKLRFGDVLKYQIDISDVLMQLNVKIPPLLLYPYLEYALEECVQTSDKNSLLVLKAEQEKKYITYHLIDINLGFSNLEECFIKRFAKDKISCLDLTNQRISLYNQFCMKKLEFYKEEYLYNGEFYPSLTFKIKK